LETDVIKPIGFVRVINGDESISELVINRELSDALDGIEDFSHLYVLYWMREVKSNKFTLKVHPWGNKKLPLMGIFATRAPNRPNPIGITLVRLLSKEGHKLIVKGLDAFDGTPILDIKSFDPWDVKEYKNVRVPKWWRDAKSLIGKNAWLHVLGVMSVDLLHPIKDYITSFDASTITQLATKGTVFKEDGRYVKIPLHVRHDYIETQQTNFDNCLIFYKKYLWADV